MKKHTEEMIVKTLQRLEAGEKGREVCRDLGISEQTLYNWKAKYGGLSVSDVRELRLLREENQRLKRLVADQALSIQVLKDVNSKKW
jgi:putative transposase